MNTPILVHGYIDRINPAVILLESRQEQWTVADDSLPPNSNEGMWVDVAINRCGYEVLTINKKKTALEHKKTRQLQDKLRKK